MCVCVRWKFGGCLSIGFGELSSYCMSACAEGLGEVPGDICILEA